MVCALVWPCLVVSGLFVGAAVGVPAEDARSRGRDAVWLGHGWVDGRHSEADVQALAARLRGGGVRDLFVHAGPLSDDGGLDPALHPRAAWAVHALKRAVPGVRVQAWLGQRVDPGRLELDDADTRDRIVASTRQVLDAGFDGVHFNFEPTPDGSVGLLSLLDQTRALTRSRAAVLSISAHHVEPLPGTRLADVVIGHPKWWTSGYLSQVARRVDQVALMSYDSGLPTATLYTGYVRWQTEVALGAVPAGTDLLIGVPAYHEKTRAHRPSAETTAAAVRGVRLALGPAGRREFGVALYADFAATDADWNAYRFGWAHP